MLYPFNPTDEQIAAVLVIVGLILLAWLFR